MRLLSFFLLFSFSSGLFAATQTKPANPDEMVKQFSKMHEQLMPIVAVADMFYGCHLNKAQEQYTLEFLINDMDKELLATKLSECLGEENLASDNALNYGIKACFSDQMSHLPDDEQQKNIEQVDNVLAELPRSERQKSFTQCVNNQTLKYLGN
ncbi:hypothetical protein RI845_17565 [Thalassotalea nanhaiensis]|uniref:DUF3015 domain-containing protein n=1 Tax=Thalassotalea nanhaiensis TaxID=3065648 RepID=A0ABY9TKL3_9GAMM|nr:hypothetical protein RI845_17565 [Colwelliaceae bacterium SQ345]